MILKIYQSKQRQIGRTDSIFIKKKLSESVLTKFLTFFAMWVSF